MEVFAIENFNKLKPSSIPMEQFYSHLSDYSDQDTSTNETNLRIILQFIITNQMIATYMTTMWDHTDG